MLRDDLLRVLREAVPERVVPVVRTPWSYLSGEEFAEAEAACDPVDEVALGRLYRRGLRRAEFGFFEVRCSDTLWPSPPLDPAYGRCISGTLGCGCLTEFLDGSLEFEVAKEARYHLWRVHVARRRVVAREFAAVVAGV